MVQAETDGDATTASPSLRPRWWPTTPIRTATLSPSTSFGDAIGGTITQDAKTQGPDFDTTDNFVGDASFTYTVDDGSGGTDIATVTIRSLTRNDPPDAINDRPSYARGHQGHDQRVGQRHRCDRPTRARKFSADPAGS